MTAQHISPTPTVELPSHLERMAHLLKTQQGMTDAEIALLLNCSRGTANRYRSRFRAKVAAIRLAFPDCACQLLGQYVNPN